MKFWSTSVDYLPLPARGSSNDYYLDVASNQRKSAKIALSISNLMGKQENTSYIHLLTPALYVSEELHVTHYLTQYRKLSHITYISITNITKGQLPSK